MKTLAAVLTEINKPLAVEELSIPDLKPGQVLVKVAFSGVCHSQLNEIKGRKGEDKFLPHTLGHEGSGIVEQVGPGVSKVVPGDHVVLTWIKAKGADVLSTQYKRHDGSIVNSGAISTFLTKAVISENRLVKIPKEMPLKEAALLGCAIPTGAGIVMNTAKANDQSVIAIFGVGGIGLSAVMGAKIVNAKTIIAVDIMDKKLELARSLGATNVVNSSKEDPLQVISKLTGGRGADFAVECAGKKETMEKAFKSVRDNGGLCILAGNLPKGVEVSIDPFDLIKGKRVIGSWGGETDPDIDIPKYVDLCLSGKLQLDTMSTNHFKIENINNAFRTLADGEAGRVLIYF
jgi:S-(hydroxymethyl)glutathione dehydrogenase/alcohol dehydrogenase